MDASIFGLIVADVIASPMDLRSPPPPGGLRVIDAINLTTGGNAANVSIAMSKLGMNVSACGIVGKDILGAALIERLEKSGVNVAYIFSDDRAQTSATIVAVQPDGERSFFHTTGVTALLDPQALRRCFSTFAASPFLHIGYFGLLPSLTQHLPALLREFRQLAPNTKIALDTAHPPAPADLLWPILPHVDIFAPSRPEAAALTGESDPKKMLAAFHSRMPHGMIAIKLDVEGCLLDDGQSQIDCPAYPVDVIDTTGAGDAWFAGLLTALRKNMPLDQAARLANRVAADSCTALGASAGIRSFEDSLARM